MKHVLLALVAIVSCLVTGGCGRRQATRPAENPTLDLGKNVTVKLVLIPAGTFTMGCPETEEGRDIDQGPQHEVEISKPFYMGVYEVTQLQWETVMGANPSQNKGTDLPVESVSWHDAVSFCKKASERTGKVVRLPTEAEWEYACRAGSRLRFCFGDDQSNLADYAWYIDKSAGNVHPVGQKKPNAWGLYDMHGNVWERCADWYAYPYPNAKAKDPQGPGSGSLRVLRGGSWNAYVKYCRSAARGGNSPDTRSNDGGFRVVVDAPK